MKKNIKFGIGTFNMLDTVIELRFIDIPPNGTIVAYQRYELSDFSDRSSVYSLPFVATNGKVWYNVCDYSDKGWCKDEKEVFTGFGNGSRDSNTQAS